jgi:hypothetical protein
MTVEEREQRLAELRELHKDLSREDAIEAVSVARLHLQELADLIEELGYVIRRAGRHQPPIRVPAPQLHCFNCPARNGEPGAICTCQPG